MRNLGIQFLVWVFFFSIPLFGGPSDPPMKIAVAAKGKTVDAQVESQGARCAWFLFFDEKGNLTEVIENPNKEKRGQAGVKCAELMAEKQVTVFVAGNAGGRLADALESAGIQFFAFIGAVKDAVTAVLK